MLLTNTAQILTTISRSRNGLLFPDPIFLIFNVAVELLKTQSITQLLPSCLHRIVQCTEPLSKLHLLCLYVLGVKMSSSNKLISSLCGTVNAVLQNKPCLCNLTHGQIVSQIVHIFYSIQLGILYPIQNFPSFQK